MFIIMKLVFLYPDYLCYFVMPQTRQGLVHEKTTTKKQQ